MDSVVVLGPAAGSAACSRRRGGTGRRGGEFLRGFRGALVVESLAGPTAEWLQHAEHAEFPAGGAVRLPRGALAAGSLAGPAAEWLQRAELAAGGGRYAVESLGCGTTREGRTSRSIAVERNTSYMSVCQRRS